MNCGFATLRLCVEFFSSDFSALFLIRVHLRLLYSLSGTLFAPHLTPVPKR